MFFISGQRRSGKWFIRLQQLSACWKNGETTSMLTSRYVRFESTVAEEMKSYI